MRNEKKFHIPEGREQIYNSLREHSYLSFWGMYKSPHKFFEEDITVKGLQWRPVHDLKKHFLKKKL